MVLEMNCDLLELPNFEACGKNAILILLEIAKSRGWTPKLLDMRNSGDTAGEKSNVVGYAAIAFVEGDERQTVKHVEGQPELSREDGEYLVSLARQALEHYIETSETLEVDEEGVHKSCCEMRGCFVTLTKKGQLRGCIGSLIPSESLYKNVIENAVNAAVNDRRFKEVKEEELDEIRIEVSVLTLPRKLRYSNSDELLEELRPGTDGVILTFLDQVQSTYLPQVWEQIPDKEQFLNALTRKAHPRLPSDAWKTKYAKVFVYQAQVFEEAEEQMGNEERSEDED
jgi:AmmeMemoRadiSam system protein A